MTTPARIALALLAGALAVHAQAPGEETPPVYVEQDMALEVVAEADALAAKGRWVDVISRYQKLLREKPEEMVPIDATRRSYVGVSQYIFVKLAKMPPEAIAEYRRLYDPSARTLFKEALLSGSDSEIAQVASQWFFTEVGDDASLLVAGRLEESGLLREAGTWYERVAVAYPREGAPEAWICARWALCSRRSGDRIGWERAKAALLAQPDSVVRLAGREVTAAEAAELIEKVEKAPALSSAPPHWPRHGGNNAGTKRGMGAATNDVRLWQFPARTQEQVKEHRVIVKNSWWRGMAQFKEPFVYAQPAVTRDGTVVYSDGRTVWFVELATGQVLGTSDKDAPPKDMFRATMTENPQIVSLIAPVVTDTMVFVNRVPATVRQGQPDPKASSLVAYSLADQTELWNTSRDAELDELWFGSPPILHDGRLYAAAVESGRGEHSIVLVVLDALTGRMLTRRFLCAGSGVPPGWNQFNIIEAPMIAEAGGVLYISTNIGAVAAVRASSLDVLWLSIYAGAQPGGRFPRQQMSMRNGRGLSPVVIDSGRVCVFPGDSDSYLEFDIRTGTTLLSVSMKSPRKPSETPTDFLGIVHVETAKKDPQGVPEERVMALFSTRKAASYLDLSAKGRDGTTSAQLYEITPPSVEKDAGDQPLAGRGAVGNTEIYFPHRDRMSVIGLGGMKLRTSYRWESELRDSDAGSILLLGDYTLTFSESGMTCFVTRESFDRAFDAVLKEGARDWAGLVRHAEVLERNPRTWAGAIQDYERIAAQKDDQALATQARTRLASLYRKSGDALLTQSPADFRGAVASYRKAISVAPTDEALGDLLRYVGECHKKLGEWPEAIAAYQEAIERYGDRLLTGADGLTRTVREFASMEIAGIIQERGAEVYKAVEERARRLLDEEKTRESLEELRRWFDLFPNSSAAPEAAELLVSRLEAAGRPGEALTLLRRIADRAPGSAEAGAAVARAAAILLRLGDRPGAQLLALRLESRHGEAELRYEGRPMTGAEAARAIREAVGALPAAQERPEPVLACTWRSAEEDLQGGDPAGMGLLPGPTLLVPTGAWAGLDPDSVVLLQRRSTVEARDVSSDRVLWRSTDPRGWMGITWVSADGATTDISAVTDKGPADTAGMKAGDLAWSWNGEPIRNQDHYKRLICSSAGKTVQVGVRRGGERLVLTVTVGRRDPTNDYNEPVTRAVFAGGLLVLVRVTTVEALNPATGEQVWLHTPVHPGGARVATVAASDGRVFLGWAIPTAEGVAGPAKDLQVTLEALSAATGRLLWSRSTANSEVQALFAPEGTGIVVRCSKRQTNARLMFMNAETGAAMTAGPEGDAGVEVSADGERPAVAVDGHRVSWLQDINTVMVKDLMTGRDRPRDLGGMVRRPVALDARDGTVVLAYTGPDAIVVLPGDPAAPRLNAVLPEGRLEIGGLHLLDAGRLLVQTLPARPADSPERILRRFEIAPAAVKETWRRNLGRAKALSGTLTGFQDHIVTWAQEEGGALGVRWMKESNVRTRWEVRVEKEDAAGALESVGVQGRIVYAQFGQKLVIWR